MIDTIYNAVITFCGCSDNVEFGFEIVDICPTNRDKSETAFSKGFEMVDICPPDREKERKERRYSDTCVWELPDYLG
jgi:hypothetical protein